MAEDDGRLWVVVLAGGDMVVEGVAGVGEVVVDGGAVVVLPPPGAAGVVDAASATLMLNFIPPLQWPGTPQMK